MKRFYFVLILLLTVLPHYAFAGVDDDDDDYESDGPSAEIYDNDGEKFRVRLMPLEIDESHAEVVRRRLAKGSPVSEADLPEKYTISTELLSPVRDQGRRPLCAFFLQLAF